jgi:hypothetical protein
LNIRHVTYNEIDKQKWDDCIRRSVNGLIYTESVYLDTMAAHWDGIVLDDYEAVMPLTWKKKWGIQYVYQPPFMQQGGIFFKKNLSAKTVNSFLAIAVSKFRFAEFTCNAFNPVKTEKDIQLKLRNNFILPLGNGYKKIFSAYDVYIKQRLTRLKKFNLQYKHSNDHEEVIELYQQLYKERMESVTVADFSKFKKLCDFYAKTDRVIVREVYDMENELLASVVLLRDDRRLYNIISCVLPKGKKLLANYFLYNEIIREFASERIILDFEGSDIPGVAYFYSKFAGSNEKYPFIKFNRLPMPIRLLKK